MKISEVMVSPPEYVDSSSSIRDAARRMVALESEFIPVAKNDEITGIVTDRDIVKKSLLDGNSPDDPVSFIETSEVHFCTEDDEIYDVLQIMETYRVQRLVVLNNLQDKYFIGIVSLNDIAEHSRDDETNKRIAACCRNYRN